MAEQQAADFKHTINLPQTDFPMKAQLPIREPERLAKWKESALGDRILENRKGAPDFILHDGPPYANGDIHMGHALNKTLKDVVVRYQTMKGCRSYYVPGFDCHGLPIEQKVLQRLEKKARDMAPIEIRQHCHEEAVKWIGVQTEQFQRLGIGGDWEHPYRTLDPDVEVGILRALEILVDKGVITKGFKPVLWDPIYRTALAEAEIEYEEHVSDSVYVKFPLNNPGEVSALAGLDNVSVVIWTTTPWTLPANLAVCLHPELPYVVLGHDDQHYIVARGLAEAFCKECGLGEPNVVAEVRSADLENKTCKHPIFADKPSLVILGDHVTLEAGTGCVHTAPGHGTDDFIVGKRYGLDVFVPVDDGGCFTDDYPEMAGTFVFKANEPIIEKLKAAGLLLAHKKFEHQYPHSWRSHKPVIFRATAQWFVELDNTGIRSASLKAIDNDVQWIPKWGRDRIYNMVEQRPEWCLSRQRSWGVPIPSIRSKANGDSVLDGRIIEKLITKVAEQGTDAWFTVPLEEIWPEGFVYEPTGESKPSDFEKEFDIVDVWFDSGSTHIGVLEAREGLSSPASLYLEGSDQHRGWFQSSLLIGMGTRGHAPFKAVLTHGFILDEKGQPMSKSKGNVISPLEIMKDYGADGLRLWVISEDYRSDVAIGNDRMKGIAETYRRIRNTFRFLMGNLSDFDPERHSMPVEGMEELDRWMLHHLNDLIAKVTQYYDTYEFHRIYHLVQNFCTVKLSALYLDITKDRMYCSHPDDPGRRAAQTVMYYNLSALVRMMAPVMVFTADEAWEYANLGRGQKDSVHLADFPVPHAEWAAPELLEKWEELLELRVEVSRILEEARRSKEIGNSLDAVVTLQATKESDREFLVKNIALLKILFIVSGVRVEEKLAGEAAERWHISTAKSAGAKCERCRIYDPEIGADPAHSTLCPRCADVVSRLSIDSQGPASH